MAQEKGNNSNFINKMLWSEETIISLKWDLVLEYLHAHLFAVQWVHRKQMGYWKILAEAEENKCHSASYLNS